jgi:hypothetical protein
MASNDHPLWILLGFASWTLAVLMGGIGVRVCPAGLLR